MNLLESLKRWTTVVADTGDINAIAEHRPQDATTNPSLLLHAGQQPQHQALVDDALDFALRGDGDRAARSVAFMDRLFIDFGREILKIVPGRVSTEVDAGLSFDTEGTLAKASAHRYYACMPRHRSRSGVIRWHPICQSSFLPGTATRPGPTRTSTRVEPTCR
jgi:transaldolase